MAQISANDPIVVLSYARTPMGGLSGVFADVSATDLGATAVKAAVERAGVKGEDIERIYMGCVLPAGLGQAPARQAALKAGLPKSVEATTVNKVCGSGMQTVIMGAEALASGSIDMVIAGGMESMTRAPFLMQKHRAGQKYGHDKLFDHMALDGLEDAYEGKAMGVYADAAAKDYQFTREAQDAYALETLRRAQNATTEGRFKREIAPIELKTGNLDTDELPRKARPDKIPSLKPAFTPDGTVTAANASAISDGAAALVLMRRGDAEKQGKKILATVVAQASHAQEPQKFTSAPVPAIQKALARAGWKTSDIDLWEINEAFAVVPMIAMKELGISHDIINVNGGACALGHPIGASGARILVTLLAALEAQNAKRGIASLCIGGGEGIALAVERS